MDYPSLQDREWVLLDAGGTLITLEYERVRDVLDELGQPSVDDEQLDRAEAHARQWADSAVRERRSTRELWDGYFSRLLHRVGVSSCTVTSACDRLWDVNQKQGLWRKPVPEAHDVLEALHASGRKLAVISNAEGQVEADLRELGLADRLAAVIDSHVVGVAKPDPQIFEIALERIGARAEQALYVGDVPAFDVEGARAAGIPPVLIDAHDLYPEMSAEMRFHRVRRLRELPGLLGVSFETS